MKDSDGHCTHEDPLRDLLVANGVDWDRVTGWPELEINGGNLWVEMIQQDADGCTILHRGGDPGVYLRMEPYPLVEMPDPDFWSAYQHTRVQALRRRELAMLADSLRWGAGPHPTVVILEQSDALMFVQAAPADTEQVDSVVGQLRALLPGVEVAVVSGFDTLMHRPARKVRG